MDQPQLFALSSTANKVLPVTIDERTITLAFGSSGQLARPNPADGYAATSSEIDNNRTYKVELTRILFDTLTTGTTDNALQFMLKGEKVLPHTLGYGPGDGHDYVTLTGTDFTTAAATEFVNAIVLSTDLGGNIKFGKNPSIRVRDGKTGAERTFTMCYLTLRVTQMLLNNTTGGP